MSLARYRFSVTSLSTLVPAPPDFDIASRRCSTTLRLRSKRLLPDLPLRHHNDLRVILNRSHLELTSVSQHVRILLQRHSIDVADVPHHMRLLTMNAIHVSFPTGLLDSTTGLSWHLPPCCDCRPTSSVAHTGCCPIGCCPRGSGTHTSLALAFPTSHLRTSPPRLLCPGCCFFLWVHARSLVRWH